MSLTDKDKNKGGGGGWGSKSKSIVSNKGGTSGHSAVASETTKKEVANEGKGWGRQDQGSAKSPSREDADYPRLDAEEVYISEERKERAPASQPRVVRPFHRSAEVELEDVLRPTSKQKKEKRRASTANHPKEPVSTPARPIPTEVSRTDPLPTSKRTAGFAQAWAEDSDEEMDFSEPLPFETKEDLVELVQSPLQEEPKPEVRRGNPAPVREHREPRDRPERREPRDRPERREPRDRPERREPRDRPERREPRDRPERREPRDRPERREPRDQAPRNQGRDKWSRDRAPPSKDTSSTYDVKESIREIQDLAQNLWGTRVSPKPVEPKPAPAQVDLEAVRKQEEFMRQKAKERQEVRRKEAEAAEAERKKNAAEKLAAIEARIAAREAKEAQERDVKEKEQILKRIESKRKPINPADGDLLAMARRSNPEKPHRPPRRTDPKPVKVIQRPEKGERNAQWRKKETKTTSSPKSSRKNASPKVKRKNSGAESNNWRSAQGSTQPRNRRNHNRRGGHRGGRGGAQNKSESK